MNKKFKIKRPKDHKDKNKQTIISPPAKNSMIHQKDFRRPNTTSKKCIGKNQRASPRTDWKNEET